MTTPAMPRTALLMLAALSAGCYSYVPVEDVEPGTRVRSYLTAPAAVRVAEVTEDASRTVEGHVVRADDQTLVLGVRVDFPRGYSMPRDMVARTDTLRLARTDILELQTPQLSVWKTSLFVGALVGGAALVTTAVLAGGGGTGDPGPGDDRTTSRVPVDLILIQLGTP